jgi:hypothetical protein
MCIQYEEKKSRKETFKKKHLFEYTCVNIHDVQSCKRTFLLAGENVARWVCCRVTEDMKLFAMMSCDKIQPRADGISVFCH